jgi:hypothetical protein
MPECKCYPSPPGQTTQCQSGQIAICCDDGTGCKGSCVGLNPNLSPLEYAAAVLEAVLKQPVSTTDLRTDPALFDPLISELIWSHTNSSQVSLTFRGRVYNVGVDLPNIAYSKLTDALKVTP